MIFAHLMGVPVEESVLALAPAGAAILSGAVVIARSKLAQIVGWLRRRSAVPATPKAIFRRSGTNWREGAGGWR